MVLHMLLAQALEEAAGASKRRQNACVSRLTPRGPTLMRSKSLFTHAGLPAELTRDHYVFMTSLQGIVIAHSGPNLFSRQGERLVDQVNRTVHDW
jgi:hypothetical protein